MHAYLHTYALYDYVIRYNDTQSPNAANISGSASKNFCGRGSMSSGGGVIKESPCGAGGTEPLALYKVSNIYPKTKKLHFQDSISNFDNFENLNFSKVF